MNRRLAALIVGVLILTVACGDDSPAADEELVDDVVAAMFLSPPEGIPEDAFGDDEARCWATAMVEAVGKEGLESVGFGAGGFATPAEAGNALDSVGSFLDEASAREYLGEAMDCVDFGMFIAEEMVADGVSREAADCMGDRLAGSDVVLDSLVAGILNQELPEDSQTELMSTTFEVMSECMSPEEIAELMGG